MRQAEVLLKQDKEYFSKQISELQHKLSYSDEKLIQLADQLERAKQSREELYDKYVASRFVFIMFFLNRINVLNAEY